MLMTRARRGNAPAFGVGGLDGSGRGGLATTGGLGRGTGGFGLTGAGFVVGVGFLSGAGFVVGLGRFVSWGGAGFGGLSGGTTASGPWSFSFGVVMAIAGLAGVAGGSISRMFLMRDQFRAAATPASS